MNKLEEIKTKINANKEILELLPKNNKKNINIYLKKIEELQSEFTVLENELLEEIKKRFDNVNKIQPNNDIATLEQELNNIEGILYLLNEVDTSYDKMDLDRAIQNLSYYYKKNLEIVNESIVFCIKKFREVGIELEEKDFFYSSYVKEYIKLFLYQLQEGEIEPEKIKNKFEEIYWKCPELITHIQLNFRHLYLKNNKIIDKFFLKQKEALLRKYTAEDITKRYSNLKIQITEERERDKYILTTDFLEGKLSTKDYSKENVKNNYRKFIAEEILQEADENKLKEIDINLIKLLNSIYEYKNYLKYQYIIDDIKNIYKEKEKYKNSYNEIKKEIAKKEQKLIKINEKIEGKGVFKKQGDNYTNEQNNLISELKALYKELNKNKVYHKVYTNLNDNSSISDVLFLASSFYKYLVDCMRNKDKELGEDEIEKDILDLREFVKWPYTTILNNITILEEKSLMLIIKDKYSLLNINISKEDLEPDNLDYLIDILENIKKNYNIRISGINVEELQYTCEFKKILNK